MTALVQFAEKNFSRRDISKLSGDGILVRSIWRTIQGEGPFAGMPATFIRLGGCNRGAKTDSCAFCDTDFLVSRSSVYSVANLVQSVASLPEKLVVITGGEPVMHPKLDELVSALLAAGYRVQLESNGDFVRSDSSVGACLVVSPKLSTNAGKYATPHREMLLRADCLKILVDSNPDSPYHLLPPYLDEFAALKGSEHIFISPTNVYARPLRAGEISSMWGDLYDRAACAKNHAFAADVAQENGYRLSIQMHAFAAVP